MITALYGQLDLFGEQVPTAIPATAPTRTWADMRPGDRTTYDVPGSLWHGHWTVRRIQPHLSARYLLIVDLVDADGRTWTTWRHRDVPADPYTGGDR